MKTIVCACRIVAIADFNSQHFHHQNGRAVDKVIGVGNHSTKKSSALVHAESTDHTRRYCLICTEWRMCTTYTETLLDLFVTYTEAFSNFQCLSVTFRDFP